MIFVDTNVISEALRRSPDSGVISWLTRYDAELALPTVTIAEIAFGISKIHPDQRAQRLEHGLSEWRRRFADRIFGLTETAAWPMERSWAPHRVAAGRCPRRTG